jgi:hypothetical protein
MPILEDIYAKERARQLSTLPFFYSTQFTNNAVAVATTVTQSINIQSDSHFVARYFAITVYDSPNIIVSATLAPLTIQFFDTGSGRTLFDNPQSIQNVCGGAAAGAGNGALPFLLPEPWLIRAGGSIQVTVANITLTSAGGGRTFPRVDVSMPGFKVFKFGGGVPGTDIL